MPQDKWDFRGIPRGPATYRMYDQDDALLYVGVSENLSTRFRKHRSTKSWWGEVDYIEWDDYSTREEAERVEASLISDQCPRYNVATGTGRFPK